MRWNTEIYLTFLESYIKGSRFERTGVHNQSAVMLASMKIILSSFYVTVV